MYTHFFFHSLSSITRQVIFLVKYLFLHFAYYCWFDRTDFYAIRICTHIWIFTKYACYKKMPVTYNNLSLFFIWFKTQILQLFPELLPLCTWLSAFIRLDFKYLINWNILESPWRQFHLGTLHRPCKNISPETLKDFDCSENNSTYSGREGGLISDSISMVS